MDFFNSIIIVFVWRDILLQIEFAKWMTKSLFWLELRNVTRLAGNVAEVMAGVATLLKDEKWKLISHGQGNLSFNLLSIKADNMECLLVNIYIQKNYEFKFTKSDRFARVSDSGRMWRNKERHVENENGLNLFIGYVIRWSSVLNIDNWL